MSTAMTAVPAAAPDEDQPSTLVVNHPGNEFHGQEVTFVAHTRRGGAVVRVYDDVHALLPWSSLRIIAGSSVCR